MQTQKQSNTPDAEQEEQEEQQKFNLNEYVRDPFQRLTGEPEHETWVVNGLMKDGGLGILAARPKAGKSSISRSLLVSVAKGEYFLRRETRKSEGLLVSFEDYGNAIDEHLKALGWNSDSDAAIHIIDRQSSDNFGLLVQTLDAYPNVKLVVIDHFMKFARVSDLNESKNVQPHITRLRDEARKRNIHILLLCHLKKGETSDTFDQILGSTAIRGEADVNMAIICNGKQRHLTAEVRRGRPIPPSVLTAEIVPANDVEMPVNFKLGDEVDDLEEKGRARAEQAKLREREAEIIGVLQNHDDGIPQSELLKRVKGKTTATVDSLRKLEQSGVITRSGKPLVVSLAASDGPVDGLSGIALWKMRNLGTVLNPLETQ